MRNHVHIKELIALLLVVMLMMSAAVSADAAANSIQNGWVNYSSGGYIYIPESFSLITHRGTSLSEGYIFEYYNANQQMNIVTREYDVSSQGLNTIVIQDNYNRLIRTLPEAVYNDYSENEFTLSGYSGRNIYYIQYTLDHGTLYTIEFNYPTANRRVCDLYVENVCYSFSTTGTMMPGTAKPGPADLDKINSDIKYPNYSWMYLDEYQSAVVSHNKAVYCFKDPDTDIWRKGNYFTVNSGTAVTILAKSEGYACVILTGTRKSGWINLDYLKVTGSSRTTVPVSGNNLVLKDGDYDCTINWSLNPKLSDYSLKFRTGNTSYEYPMVNGIAVCVYGWGHDGYHEIIYTCEELDRDRYGNSFDFVPGNSSEASITICDGMITSLSIHYAE